MNVYAHDRYNKSDILKGWTILNLIEYFPTVPRNEWIICETISKWEQQFHILKNYIVSFDYEI